MAHRNLTTGKGIFQRLEGRDSALNRIIKFRSVGYLITSFWPREKSDDLKDWKILCNTDMSTKILKNELLTKMIAWVKKILNQIASSLPKIGKNDFLTL